MNRLKKPLATSEGKRRSTRRLIFGFFLALALPFEAGAAHRDAWKNHLVKKLPSANEKKIALTFDDGPTPEITPRVLEILRHEGVQATFFLVGSRIDDHPEIARAIVEAGHAIGNHSYSHQSLRGKSALSIRADIEKAEHSIQSATGQRTTIFRAPYGLWSRRLLDVSESLGYKAAHWTISSRDWRRLSARTITHRCLSKAHPGAIILLHDGFGRHKTGNREPMLSALPTIIQSLRRDGYVFVPLPELIERNKGLQSQLIALKWNK